MDLKEEVEVVFLGWLFIAVAGCSCLIVESSIPGPIRSCWTSDSVRFLCTRSRAVLASVVASSGGGLLSSASTWSGTFDFSLALLSGGAGGSSTVFSSSDGSKMLGDV
jgi:hypothetical protein